jgi:transposase
VEEIELPSPVAADDQEAVCIGEKVTYRLGNNVQVPMWYLSMCKKTYKKKGEILSSPSAPSVIDRSIADVSFLAGMVVDKVMFHLPLYRQHQRLIQGGVHLQREQP